MTYNQRLPRIIQGGMGVAVSNWRLAKAVASTGNLGVVSGTMLDTVLVRRLQDGDPGGEMRRAMAHFPIPQVADDVLRRHFRRGGRNEGEGYRLLPMYQQFMSASRQRLTMLANFVEVWLAKEGHEGPVGINLLTKVQLPNLASLYGAMLADVAYVIMGAGIPREIPGALDDLAQHRRAQLRFEMEGQAAGEVEYLELDPSLHWEEKPPRLRRPDFIAVVSASSLATTLARKSNGRVDGFVVEAPSAGGHNAPPRGELRLSDDGEPIYGDRDVVDLEKLRELGLPFWLAGGTGSPARLREAIDAGAAGIQVGTLFAFCNESGIAPQWKESVLDSVRRGDARVHTDPKASPTGYPFKVVHTSPASDAHERTRVCDLGYLRVAVKGAAGRTIYRCAAEPVHAYAGKGGNVDDTVGRRCLCNGLTATVGFAQIRPTGVEPPLITGGDELTALPEGFRAGCYGAADVIAYLERSS